MTAVAAAVIAGVAGCGGGISTAAKSSYLADLRDQIPGVNAYASNTFLVRLGEAACTELASRVSFATIVDQIEGGRLSVSDLATVVTVAGEELCPKYASAVG